MKNKNRPYKSKMARIRNWYKVPAKRGMEIKFQGKPAVITGTSRDGGLYLTARYTEGHKGRCLLLHPTWAIEYPKEAELY